MNLSLRLIDVDAKESENAVVELCKGALSCS